MKTKLAPIAPMGFVVLAFIVSRLLYLRAGLQFDLTPPRYFYQFIDPELLQNRLFESLWYLHSQPPLFNLFTGLLYQWFSPQSRIYQLLFLALGLAFCLVLYWLGLRLGLRRWLSASLAAWFMVSPATVLYENLLFYTYPVAFMLVLSALLLSKFLETENFWWGLSFFALLASLCLTWALFHLVWMLAVIVLVGSYYRSWQRLALISLIPIMLVTGWYAKNYVLFGSFGASSWAGMNLSHVTFLSPLTPEPVREDLIDYPVVEAFRSIDHYEGFMPIPPSTGFPVLDQPLKSTEAANFNHSFYIDLSERMLEDALDFIQTRPDLYFASVKQGFSIYFHSSSDYLLLKDKPAPQLETWWDRIFYGQLRQYGEESTDRWKGGPRYVGWWLVVMYAAVILYGVKWVLAPDKSDPAFLAVVAFMTFTIIYFTVMANFMDLGENNRFRFALDPLVLLLFGRLIQDLVLGWRSRVQDKVLLENQRDRINNQEQI